MKIIKKIIKYIIPHGLHIFYKNYLLFLFAKITFKYKIVRENSVLLLEFYKYHGEVLPGMIKYLLDLGYNVDVTLNLSNPSSRNKIDLFIPFQNNENVRIINLNNDYKMNILLRSTFIRLYKHIIINTFMDSLLNSIRLHKVNIFNLNPVCMIHNPEDIKVNFNRINKIITLVNMKLVNNKSSYLVNSHYFCEFEIKNKTPITTFITFNNNNLFKHNMYLLFNACNILYKNNISNFKVKIIGYGIDIPDIYKDNFEILGYIDFKNLYNEISNSDFILALIDQSSTHFINKSSGSYQLSYGFLKPIILNKIFSENSGFTHANSILYNNDNDLAATMEKCIKMPNNEYDILVNELKKTEEDLYNTSLTNLKKVLELPA